MPRTALVVSGGGAKGAFAVGVGSRLRAGPLRLDFDLTAGTSTGAIIAPFALLGDFVRLKQLYQRFDSAQLFRELTPVAAFQAGFVLDTGPLRTMCQEAFTQDVFDALRGETDAGKQLVLTTVALGSGRLVYFFMGPDLVRPPDRDAIRIESPAELVDAVMASASQPAIMAPATVRGTVYCDGGVREYAPVRVAIDNGATDVYTVLLSPPAPEPRADVQGLVDTLLRTLNLFSNEVGRDDVETPRAIRDAVALTSALRARLSAALPNERAAVDAAIDAALAESPFGAVRVANLFVIEPDVSLLNDALRFTVQDMSRMIAAGADKTDRLVADGMLRPARVLV